MISLRVATVGLVVSVASGAFASRDDARAGIANRVNMQASRIVPQVDPAAVASARFSDINTARFRDSVASFLATERWMDEELTGLFWRGYSGGFRAESNQPTGHFELARSEGSSASGERVSGGDDVFSLRGVGIAKALGFSEAQFAGTKVRRLMGQSQETVAPGVVSEPEHKATKVFIERELGGVPVWGDRVVVTFDRDGYLLRVWARWHSVDFSESYFGGPHTREAVVAAAVDALASKGAELAPESDVRIVTALIPQYFGLNGTIMHLRGVAAVNIPSIPGRTRPTALDFGLRP